MNKTTIVRTPRSPTLKSTVLQETIRLSPKAGKRYQHMTHAFEKKTLVLSAGSVDTLMEQLH